MQFQIITAVKSEDLWEWGESFIQESSYCPLHMAFIGNKIKFSKSLDEGETLNTYSEHIPSLASLLV